MFLSYSSFYSSFESCASSNYWGSRLRPTYPTSTPISGVLLTPFHIFWFPLPLSPIYNLHCLECQTRFLIIFWHPVSPLGIPSFFLMPNWTFKNAYLMVTLLFPNACMETPQLLTIMTWSLHDFLADITLLSYKNTSTMRPSDTDVWFCNCM